MLCLIVVVIMLGFPTAFTLMGLGIVFGWVAFESREARDVANEKVAADPRMADLIESSNSGFDAKRMAYGGFKWLV